LPRSEMFEQALVRTSDAGFKKNYPWIFKGHLNFLSNPYKTLTNPLFLWKQLGLLMSTCHFTKLSDQSESVSPYLH
jgi:hypothetical protein